MSKKKRKCLTIHVTFIFFPRSHWCVRNCLQALSRLNLEQLSPISHPSPDGREELYPPPMIRIHPSYKPSAMPFLPDTKVSPGM